MRVPDSCKRTDMEEEWLARLRQRADSQLLGDDAAVLDVVSCRRLVSVDMLTEGVDFLLTETKPELIGRKALAVNLSDMAAMAGVPTDVLIAFALPRTGGVELAHRLYGGMEPLLEKYHVRIAGGDTNAWDGGLVLSITVLGDVTSRGPLRRSGGKPGDRLFVTGPLGGSILKRQFTFEPRVFESLYLHENFDIRAGMDISDGLSLDLYRLVMESKLGATLFQTAIPIAEDAKTRSKQTGKPAVDHALSDGEDFELLLAVEPKDAKILLATQPLQEQFGVTLFEIGALDAEPGLRLQLPNGKIEPLVPHGFWHI